MDQLEAVIYKFPMAGKTKVAAVTDESGSTPLLQGTRPAGKDRRREFLRAGKKDLTESDLASPAAQRFMIAEIDRLEAECSHLRAVTSKYEDLRVEHASLSASATTSRWLEILSAVCLMAGSAGLGAAPSYLSAEGFHGIGWTIAIGSSLLIIVGAISRIFR